MRDYRRLALKYLVMIEFGNSLTRLGTNPARQTGCVVWTPDCQRILGIGYNGQASGVPHSRSIPASQEPGDPPTGDLHAEVNAMMKMGAMEWPFRSLVLYITAPPCVPCAGYIINSRTIGLVIYGEDEALPDGLELLKDRKIYTLAARTVAHTWDGNVGVGHFAGIADRLFERWER